MRARGTAGQAILQLRVQLLSHVSSLNCFSAYSSNLVRLDGNLLRHTLHRSRPFPSAICCEYLQNFLMTLSTRTVAIESSSWERRTKKANRAQAVSSRVIQRKLGL